MPPSLIISAEPRAELSSPPHDGPPTVSACSVRLACHTLGPDADDSAGNHYYLVLAKPNVIMNDTRLRGLGLAGREVTLLVGEVRTTTPRPLETLGDHSGMPPLVPG